MPSTNGLETKHLNSGLFSDHYLGTVAETDEQWQSNELFSHVKNIRDELKALLTTLQPETLDEAQLEDDWIKPVLQALGHYWQVQVKVRYRKSHLKPDYLFTETEEEANQLTQEIYAPANIAHALAIGDAKKWGTNLDQGKSKKDRNPSQQIDEYIRYSELKWGILTDGRYWRLYERNTSKNNVYYAVDLVSLLEQGSIEDFYYFYFFFQREAFLKDGWLDQILKDSITYAEELSEKLEDEVYDALTLIAQGFIDYQRNWRGNTSPDLHEIYIQSLVLLYRLLFILYAESRDILPMSSNKVYATFRSLTALKKEVTTMIDFKPEELARRIDEGSYYERLGTLFYNIDIGSSQYNITAYNGRLFSDDEYPFLATKRVGNPYVAQAIDKLTRVSVKNGSKEKRVFVDYRDLEVRHLGAIYEKLLEYELAIAETDLALKDKKYVKTTDPNKAIVKVGKVYLRTGNNERKITGSYYTPDYIVSFIVGQSLEPLLNDITEHHATLADDGTWDVRDRQVLRDTILNINVLDPATGSGHFMVEVVNQIALWLTHLNLLPDDIEIDEQELTYWKRQVVSACVYGVDVNPLAVELAKLSLWLMTIAQDRPLSFLDHHVRLGNTLVGARVSQLTATLDTKPDNAKGSQQLSLFGSDAFTDSVSSAVNTMETIEHTIASVVADVKQQEKDYQQVFAGLTPWRTLAHVWTARHFGLKLSEGDWQALYQHTVGDKQRKKLPTDLQVIVDEAQKLHEQYHFFHWEFAFPEVFFDEQGAPLADGGFDAVVGNPPYVRQQNISIYKPYLKKHYEIFNNKADLYLYFYERGFKLLRDKQSLGYVTSGTYMSSGAAKNFRQYIHKNYGFDKVINFGENQPFKRAEMVFPTIAVLKKAPAQEKFKSIFVDDVRKRDELYRVINEPMVDTLSRVTSLNEWRFQSIELTNLYEKIIANKQALKEIVNDNIYYGVLTGLTDAFVIDDETRKQLVLQHQSSEKLIKPMIRGSHLRPWYQEDSDEYLILARQGINIDNYPAIKTHLQKFYDRLKVKPNDWDKKTQGKWKGRTHGSYKWYEWHDTVAYHKKFLKPKIMWPEITNLPRISFDNSGLFTNNKCCLILSDSIDINTILGLLQSRIIWFAISQMSTPLRLRSGLWQYQLFTDFIKRLPIPDLTPTQERQLADIAQEITGLAGSRYRLHEGFRHRVTSDLGHAEGKLNTKMTSWWALPDFKIFQTELKKSFKETSIPVVERDDWETYWLDEQIKHQTLTQQIITLETQLNAVVYDAFDLTADERALIEKATKYPYGAV